MTDHRHTLLQASLRELQAAQRNLTAVKIHLLAAKSYYMLSDAEKRQHAAALSATNEAYESTNRMIITQKIRMK